MCGRIVYVYDAKTGALVRKLDDGSFEDEKVKHVVTKNRYNVPPASHLPVFAGEGDAVKLHVARWGFPIPARPNGVFNTRIESAFESPMWRGLMGRQHCAFFVHGFYEWDHVGKTGDPYFLGRRDGGVALLAGVLGRRSVEGVATLCASIVTTPAAGAAAALHDRMPVILEEEALADWLHPTKAGHERIVELARPTDVLASYRVGTAVNSTQNDGPELLQPAGKKTRATRLPST
ncbi:MAG: SOS response-associated peptidase [Thermoplasmatota archaeon]